MGVLMIELNGATAFWNMNTSWLWKPPADQPQDVSPSVSAPPGASATSEPSALVTAIGGDAYATGTNTDASGVVSNTIKDMGNVTIAQGYAIFEATGTSSTQDGASADADTFLAVTGADIVVEFTFDRNVHLGNTVFAVSATAYIAIDIENWAPPNGPLVMDFHSHSANQVERYSSHLPDYAPPSGNHATVAAFADAQGANTLTATLAHSLVENQFSLVSGLAIVAA
jgi:hypothetical protein